MTTSHKTEDPILYCASKGVAVVAFNRPRQRNALDFEMVEALRGAMDRASAEREVRVVVLTGVGESFCVGVDASRLAQVDTSDPRRTSRMRGRCGRSILRNDMIFRQRITFCPPSRSR